jgi:energy-coupling factor transport system substrate-specific component
MDPTLIITITTIVVIVILVVWALLSKNMNIADDFNTMTWVLIPVAIAINVVMGQIVLVLKLPVYLDSIGTMLVGALCGPWAGALTGALSNIIWGLAIDPGAFPWWPVAFFIGLVTGFAARAGLFKNWWKVVITGFLVALTAAVVSTPIGVYLFGGITASGSSFITAYLLQTGRGVFESVFSTNFLVEPVDKISTALLAFAIIQGLSKRFLARFPRAENVEIEEGATRTQLFIAIGIVILLVLFAAFVLVNILA